MPISVQTSLAAPRQDSLVILAAGVRHAHALAPDNARTDIACAMSGLKLKRQW